MISGKAYSKLSKSDKLFLSEYVNSIVAQYSASYLVSKITLAITSYISPATFPFLPSAALQEILHFSYAGGIRDNDYRFICIMRRLCPQEDHYTVLRKGTHGYGPYRQKGRLRVK